jgi:hypothetical protein
MKTAKTLTRHKVSMHVHRALARTKPPYLARIKSTGGLMPRPIIICVHTVEHFEGFPSIGRATVIQSDSKGEYYRVGCEINVTNFRGIERIVFPDIPKSSAKP